MKYLIDQEGDKVRIQQLAAGNLVATTTFDIGIDQFNAALSHLFADETQQHSIDLPGCTLELVALEDGVRLSQWVAKNPTRTSVKLSWRDMARHLVA